MPPKIPLVDLATQYTNLRDEILKKVDTLCQASQFILGEEVQQFESNFAAWTQSKFCIGVANGTDAVSLALKSLNLEPGSEVITTPLTFVATAEAILQNGLVPVYADIDPDTLVLDPHSVSKCVGPKTKVILPVCLYGNAVDFVQINQIATSKNLNVLVDAAQAHGTLYQDQALGNWADLVCYSFFPGKTLGAFGDGGAIITNQPDLARRIQALRNHGQLQKHKVKMAGTNSRLDAIQAGILNVKLPHLKSWVQKRQELAKTYARHLSGYDAVTWISETPDSTHSYHLCVAKVKNRDRLRQALKDHHIETGIHYPYLLTQFPFLNPRAIPATRTNIVNEILSFPLYPELLVEDVERICDVVRDQIGSGL